MMDGLVADGRARALPVPAFGPRGHAPAARATVRGGRRLSPGAGPHDEPSRARLPRAPPGRGVGRRRDAAAELNGITAAVTPTRSGRGPPTQADPWVSPPVGHPVGERAAEPPIRGVGRRDPRPRPPISASRPLVRSPGGWTPPVGAGGRTERRPPGTATTAGWVTRWVNRRLSGRQDRARRPGAVPTARWVTRWLNGRPGGRSEGSAGRDPRPRPPVAVTRWVNRRRRPGGQVTKPYGSRPNQNADRPAAATTSTRAAPANAAVTSWLCSV